MTTTRKLSLPPAVRAYLVELIELRFTGRDPRPWLDGLPTEMPEGEVRRLASGGAFGWLCDARLDEVDGRIALEVLEDSRMAGPEHYRLWEDGSREELPSERTGYVVAEGAEDAFYEHNHDVQAQLRDRGFLPR